MEARFARNFDALTPEGFARLRQSRVLVAGCGGLGGYLIELMARAGVGALTVVDGDVFEESNLNRQLLSSPALLGEHKAAAAARRVAEIAPDTRVTPVCEFLTAENADGLLAGHQLVLDALDTPADRLLLAQACARAGLPLVHGAICGWQAQVSTVLPGSDTLRAIYPRGEAENSKTALSFTPALCASLQAAEAVKLLTGQQPALAGRLLLADLRTMEQQIIRLC